MGASESTARANRTKEEEEEERQRASDGSSIAAGAGMALAAVGVAAWGISRMLSDNTEKKENEGAMTMQGTLQPRYYLSNSSTNNNHGSGYELGMHGSNPTHSTWSPPLGPFKMNTDASCLQNQDDPAKRGPSGYAGVLRDHRGEWVRGFHGFMGVSDSLTAELYGIYNGLVLLDKLGLKEATLESDCTAAIGWIKQENNSNRPRSLIINDCWEMINECKCLILKNKITVSYCSRDSNKWADRLADMAIQKQEEYKDITIIPEEIKRIANQESGLLN